MGTSSDSDAGCMKEKVDYYKIVSEECRHMADIIWKFSTTIVLFQAGVVSFAITKPQVITAITLGIGGLVSFNLSRLLLRQALIRGDYLDRLHAAEDTLRPYLPANCFKAITPSGAHGYRSPDLAMFLIIVSALMGFISISWIFAELFCRCTTAGLHL
jgi:hypothetical protein